MTTITLLQILGGLLLLIGGGELLVRGASALALRVDISPLVVGLTVVAFGTSAPELLISVTSALNGSPDLAMGNVIGSNICNLALVLGLSAVVYPVRVQADSLRLDWPMTMGCSLLLLLLAWNGWLSRAEGLLMVAVLVTYTVWIVRRSRRHTRQNRLLEQQAAVDLPAPPAAAGHLWKEVLFVALGCVGLFFGAEWFVSGARTLALSLGVSERTIGLTIVALGTSLPELVTSVVAAVRKQTDIAVGNLLGSNIFNVLSILGLTSLIQPVAVSQALLNVDMWWMLAVTLLLLPMMWFRRKITRLEGVLLLAFYVYYTLAVAL